MQENLTEQKLTGLCPHGNFQPCSLCNEDSSSLVEAGKGTANETERMYLEKEGIKKAATEADLLKYDSEGNFEYAIAPNGQKSNLSERQWIEVRTGSFHSWFGDWQRYSALSGRDDLTESEQIELEELKDQVSKILDKNGEPMVIYHGTQQQFDAFNLPDQYKKYSGNYFADNRLKVHDYTGLGTMNTGQVVHEYNKQSLLGRAQEAKSKYKKSLLPWTKARTLSLYKSLRQEARKIKPDILSCYGRSVRPLIIDNDTGSSDRRGSYNNFSQDVAFAKKNNYDSVIWLNTYDGGPVGTVLNIWDARNIKSASNNSGPFNAESESITK